MKLILLLCEEEVQSRDETVLAVWYLLRIERCWGCGGRWKYRNTLPHWIVWIFGNPLLINSLTINSEFINRAENHVFFVDDYQDKGSAGCSMVLGSHTSMAIV